MKILKIILVAALVYVCWGVYNKKNTTPPTLANGVNWRDLQEQYDPGLDRYLIRVFTSSKIPNSEIRGLSEYIKNTHDKSQNLVINFEQPDRSGYYAKFIFPAGTLQELENYPKDN
jgi:hypothetical protein